MTERMSNIRSNCPSPPKIEKTDSSSSRQSSSPANSEFESFIVPEHSCRGGRTRRSSWDDSDKASSPELERCSKPSRFYSRAAEKSRSCVTAEINQLKKQFFESIEKLKDEADNQEVENLREVMKSIDDRRLSPARMRRRSKSSSSSSPVLETKNSNFSEKPKKLSESEAAFDEISSKILEFDPKIYLNNFFTEIRTKRISMIESSTEESSTQDAECNQTYNEDANDDEGFFCKTSRKLSQILEVEESKKDLEGVAKTESFSPLQTARSKKSEKILNSWEVDKTKNFKSVSFELFRKLKKPSEGSLSEREQTFGYSTNDFISLVPAKTGKTQLTSASSEQEQNRYDADLLECVCLEGNSRESTPKNENSTSVNPTARSDRSRSSGKLKTSSDPGSPTFTITLKRDSERSLKAGDVTTSDGLRKETKTKLDFGSNDSESSDSKSESRSSKESCRQKSKKTKKNSSSGSSRSNINFQEFRRPEISLKSNRSSKTQTPTGKETPWSDRIPELDLRLEKSDSHRSIKSNESNLSETQQRTRRSARSFSPISRRQTPRGLNITPVMSSSKEQNAEILRTAAWEELEKVCDTFSNRTSVSSVSRNEPETVVQKSPEPVSSGKNSRPSRQSTRKSLDSLELASRATSHEMIDEQDSDGNEKNKERGESEESLLTERSEKRLSVINELSLEELETNNTFPEKEEGKPTSTAPRFVSMKEKPADESGLQPDGGRWNELINKFSQGPINSDSGFRWNISEENENSYENFGLMESHYEPVEKKLQLEKEIEDKKYLKNSHLEYSEVLLQTMIKEKKANQVQNSQKLYYLNVDKGKSFGIGEFGDTASWNAGKTDAGDQEKPKDHGDGMQTAEVFIIPEKREKEAKSQRQLWTEVKEDFRFSFPENFGFRWDLKKSKSDVSVSTKTDENEGRISSIYKLSKQDIIEKKLLKFENYRNFRETPNKQTSSSESLMSEKVDSYNLEFESERTPRLSRSLEDLCTRKGRQSKDSLNNSETQLFHKTSQNSKDQSTNFNIFLARKEKDEMAVKSKKWLNVTEKRTTGKRKESSREYLSSRKTVSKLKLRKTNCFRNFYKRFISVFCLTSNSSAATSK